MMDYPLTVRTIYQRARTLFPDKQLATRRPGPATGWPPSAGTTTGTWRCTSRPR